MTMCDGEGFGYDNASFKEFADAHPEVHFHFIAIGEGADTTIMSVMAKDGRGSFHHET